jgi:DNA-binding PadR family transcriptional regulator
MANRSADLLQGTLDLLILKALALEPKHGWAISKRIQELSRDVLLFRKARITVMVLSADMYVLFSS